MLLRPITLLCFSNFAMALLFPAPRSMTEGQGVVGVGHDLDIIFTIQDEGAVPEDLLAAALRTVDCVTKSKHYYLSPDCGKEFLKSDYIPTLTALEIILQGSDYGTIASEVHKEASERREAYGLEVPADGRNATLKARTSLGALRGLTTFEQLFYGTPPARKHSATDVSSKQAQEVFEPRQQLTAFMVSAPVRIEDSPAFPWRGFMLDTSRHYFSKETILRTLDGMALVKLNVFHWHMTDSQSWPLSLPGFRDLAEKGAYSADEIYDEDDIAEIKRYAAERGIDVIVEIDLPGHTASIHHARPEFVVGYAKEPWKRYAHQPPAGQLRYMEDDVKQMTAELLAELNKHLPGAYFGTGGDEINENVYKDDKISQATLKKRGWTLNQALDVFMSSAWEALRPKIPLVWQEMVQDHQVDSLPDNAVVLVWQDSKDAAKIASSGRPIVLLPADHLYLDLGGGGNIIPPLGKNESDWHAQPFNTWYKIYRQAASRSWRRRTLTNGSCISFDPYKGIEAKYRHLILGGQTALWTETTDETNLESKVWPRAAAIAEIFWTGAGPDGFPLDPSKALSRFQDLRYRLVAKGIQATPLQPHWCALRPGSCDDE